MAVKDILDKFRSSREEKKQYFFALQADEELVKSAVWTVEKGVVKVLSLGDSQLWESKEEFLEAVDASLFSATEKLNVLPEKIPEPNKVIFGLAKDWTQDSKIVVDKAGLLKEIAKKLELNPIGFVITTEAIVHHLKTIEGIPPTAILIGFRKEKITVTLTKLGKIVGTELVNRSDNFGADLAEALSRFDQENVFPARILLYGGNEGESKLDLEDIRQELMNFSWEKERIEFLHLPKIEILPADFDIKAVALAGGREVAQASGIEVTSVDFSEVNESEVSEVVEEPVAPPIVEEPVVETMGFFKEKDVTQEAIPEETKKEPEKGFFPRILAKLPRFHWPGRIYSSRGLIIAALLLILGGGALAFYWYVPKAEITLLAKSQPLERDFILKLNPSATGVDRENLILPGEQMKIIEEGEKSKPTIGTKTVGEPARGELAIYNRTDTQKTFSAGTELSGPNNLKFTLDSDVTVASASAGPSYTTIPGKSTTKVTAKAIGPEGNLASGTEFSVSNFPRTNFVANNDAAFSGGTSRMVQVVAQEDQDKLLAGLNEELKNKAISDLSAKASSPKKIIPESLTSKTVEKKFNLNIGEEANELKLNLRVEFSVLSYNEDDLKNLINDQVKKDIPGGFEYQPEASKISFNLKEMTKKNVAIFTTHLETKLIPKFNLEQIKKDLVGKNPVLAKQYLDNLANIKASEIRIRPRLPGRLLTLPRLTKNIKIEVGVE